MADSAVTNDAAHAGVLHKYSAGNCSQNDYVADFGENISSEKPVGTDCLSSPDGVGAYNYGSVPNNNVSGNDALIDCLMDGSCVSNTTSVPRTRGKVYSSCGLDSSSQCDSSSQESSTSNPGYGYKLRKQLYVKLETPVYDPPEQEDKQEDPYDQQDQYDPQPDPYVEPINESCEEKHVTFNNVDENNGVIKKKRKSKEVSLSKVTTAGLKRKTQQRVGAGRGRPPKRPLIATYHSQISGDKNTIKIRIKKAHLTTQVTAPVKKTRQRKKQKKVEASDTDASDYDNSSKRIRSSDLASHHPKNPNSDEPRPVSPSEQSVWGHTLPENVLHTVFQYLCHDQGALPLLVNLSKVCKLWRKVSILPSLWENIDLSSTVKDRSKTDFKLQWLVQNRLTACQDLNLSDWKIKNIPGILEDMCENCPELRGLNLSNWSGLTAENLKALTTGCSNLERLDLSSVNGSNLGTKSALNASPLVCLAQTMAARLTHLVLAHNKLAGFSQILTAISTHCANLQLLDLSNIKTHAYNSSLLHVEKLQEGCPKLRVLRVTNSQILLAPTTITAQMASPGFPDLEELSLAGIEDDQTTSKFIDDNGIERILKTSHKLRLLDVRGCTKITDSGLVKVPAWDLEHLFLSACYVTRLNHSGLELILQKWSHSLVEVDLAWSTATEPLDAAVMTLAEKGVEAPIRTINLCGSSVSLESVKAVLAKCPHIQSINLQSCRALPRGIKRLYEGTAVAELRSSLENKPPKPEDLDSTGSEEPPVENAEDRATNVANTAENLE